MQMKYMHHSAFGPGREFLKINQGPFSISLFKLSQLEAKSWFQPSNLPQTGLLFYVQVSDLGEI